MFWALIKTKQTTRFLSTPKQRVKVENYLKLLRTRNGGEPFNLPH